MELAARLVKQYREGAQFRAFHAREVATSTAAAPTVIRLTPMQPNPASASASAAFHRTSQEEDSVHHERGDWPYGQEIIREGHDEPDTGGRRRCDWRANALSPAA